MEIPISQFIEMFGDPESVIKNAINTVADVADVQVGLVIKPTRFYSADGTGTPAFRSLNIGEMYIRDSEWVYFTDKGMVENQRTIAHTGDVLVVRSGYPGTSCVVTPEYDGRNVVDLIIAHPNVSKILPEFLCAFTNYPHGKIQIENSQRGVAQKHFNVSLYNKMKIVVPPMELQKQFVQLLHQSDKSKFACLKSQFIEMFGDPITNDKKLPVEPLSKHIELLGGFAFKSTGFVKEGIPVLRIGNINAGYFRPDDLPFWKYDKALDRYLLYPGDLAISLTGTVGKDDYGNVCRLGNDYPRYYLNQRNAKLILKDTVLPEFITALLKSRKIKDKIANAGVGVRQANISNKSILELKVPIPNLDGQNQFADFVRQSDKSKLCFHLHTTTLHYAHS